METTSESLHASDFESLGRDIMAMACEQTGAHHGAILLWDEAAGGLALDWVSLLTGVRPRPQSGMGRALSPIRYASTALATPRPSAMPHTMRL